MGLGCSKFHKIKVLRTATGTNFNVTITKQTAKQFSGCKLFEVVTEHGILLLRSGCEVTPIEGIIQWPKK